MNESRGIEKEKAGREAQQVEVEVEVAIARQRGTKACTSVTPHVKVPGTSLSQLPFSPHIIFWIQSIKFISM